MNPLTALLGLALLIVVMVALAWICLRGEGELMSGLFRAPGLGWPRGVQEEDPVAWNWEHRPAVAPPPPGSEPARSPIVERVAFRIGRGSARGGRGGPLPR